MHALYRPAALALTAAIAVAGCGGSTPAAAVPPASLDPDSPTLVAENIAFDTDELGVPANRPFTLVFENRDGASHNVAIQTSGEDLRRVFDSRPFGGPGTRWYAVPALAPGAYAFVCDLHANMTGRLVAS
jgi:plastocyanin